MLIGIPKEIKNNENRVGLTPAGVQSLVKKGHHVLVETNAGLGSGFADEDYTKQGATIVATAAEAWAAELVVKVKEPLAEEYGFNFQIFGRVNSCNVFMRIFIFTIYN